MAPLLQLSDVWRTHAMEGADVHALQRISLAVEPGECLAILGASGSGKSSLLNVLGFLDQPTSGTYFFAGGDTQSLDLRARARLRNQEIGFVFQQFHLLPNLTALENVVLPMHYAGLGQRHMAELAHSALRAVGLEKRLQHRPAQLSGGERQRVAIARAIARSPKLLLADEPTGALDSENGQKILNLLLELQQQGQMTVAIITHDISIAHQLPRRIVLRDGTIEQDTRLG